MSLCPECGNSLVVQSCSPVCLVCQHTGRHEQTATEKLMVANLRAVYAALEAKESMPALYDGPVEEFDGEKAEAEQERIGSIKNDFIEAQKKA